MTARCLCILAVLLAILVAGCGGGGSPVVIPGDYFPLVIGTVWQFSTVLEAETPSDDFNTTGTMTRTLIGTEVITVHGVPVNTYVFQHDYTTVATPNLTGQASISVAPFIDYLFSDPGGLQSVRAYYRLIAATPEIPAHVELVALSHVGGPIVEITAPRPYFLNPPYQGATRQSNLWFTPLPLMPFPTDLTEMESKDKVLNFGSFGGPGGDANAVVSIYYYSANLNVSGNLAAFAGRGRSFFKEGTGLIGAGELTDWYATINVGGNTSRVTSRMLLESITTP